MVKTALQMLYIERKKSLNLLFSITVTLCITLIFIQFQTNPHIATEITIIDIALLHENYLIAWLALIVLLVCLVLMGYSCNYFMRIHSREYGLLRLCGYSFFKILLYQIIQVSILVIIALILTLILSLIYIPLSLYIIYHYTNMNYSIFEYPISAIFVLCLIIIPLIIIIIIFMQCRYIQSNQVSDLLRQNHVAEYNGKDSSFHVPDFIYLFCYFIGLLVMFIGDEISIGFVITSCIGVFGAYGILYYLVPHIIEETLDNLKLKACNYVILGNLSLFMQQSKSLIIFIMFSVIMLPSFILMTTTEKLLHISLHIVIVLINGLLSLSIVSRHNVDYFEKRYQYRTLRHLGLQNKQVIDITKKEVLYFYIIIFVCTVIYIICLFIVFFIKSNFNFILDIIIVLEYIVPYFISFLFTFIKRGKTSWYL